MDIASINKQALAQTYYILDSFDDNTKNKVPNSLFNTIKENMDKQYQNTSESPIKSGSTALENTASHILAGMKRSASR